MFEVFAAFIIRSDFIFNRTTNEAQRRGHTPQKKMPTVRFSDRSSPFLEPPQHPQPWTWLGLALRKKKKREPPREGSRQINHLLIGRGRRVRRRRGRGARIFL